MRIEQIQQGLRAHGALPIHELRVLRAWMQARPVSAGRRRLEDFMPLTLRNALPALDAQLQGLARLRSQHPAQDGSARLLVELNDGQTVESVLLPRDGLCSTTSIANGAKRSFTQLTMPFHARSPPPKRGIVTSSLITRPLRSRKTVTAASAVVATTIATSTANHPNRIARPFY